VTLRPGDLLGLPDLTFAPAQLILLRHVLLLLCLLWALALLRARPLWGVVTGALLLDAVLLFWTLGLARPHGLLADRQATWRAAVTATAQLPGEDGPLSGEARPRSGWAMLTRAGVPPRDALVLPSLAPLVIGPAFALAILALWRPREEALLGAALWLAFSTSEVDGVKQAGFLSGLWTHPGHGFVLLALLAVTLASGRGRSWATGTMLAVGITLAWLLLGGAPAPPLGERVARATVDQLPWWLLAVAGAKRGAPASAWALVAAGSALLVPLPALAPVDVWGAQALLRLGLVLASLPALRDMLLWATDTLAPAWLRALAAAPGRVGLAALILAVVPGGFLARWDPRELDPAVFGASTEPLPASLRPSLEWIRTELPADASCVASPDYAALVAVVGERRVLRAPGLAEAPDDQRRRRVERMVVAGREPELARRYGVDCLFFANGDQGWLGLSERAALDTLPHLRRRYVDAQAAVYSLR
jgi:hypothetical protein